MRLVEVCDLAFAHDHGRGERATGLHVSATPAVHRGLLARCRLLDGGQGAPAAPAGAFSASYRDTYGMATSCSPPRPERSSRSGTTRPCAPKTHLADRWIGPAAAYRSRCSRGNTTVG